MKRHQFFHGLDGEGVVATLEEYDVGAWSVVAMGTDDNGFWICLVSPSE